VLTSAVKLETNIEDWIWQLLQVISFTGMKRPEFLKREETVRRGNLTEPPHPMLKPRTLQKLS